MACRGAEKCPKDDDHQRNERAKHQAWWNFETHQKLRADIQSTCRGYNSVTVDYAAVAIDTVNNGAVFPTM